MPQRLSLRASDIMRADVLNLRPDTRIDEAARLLVEHESPCAVVTDNEGRPVGIVSERDLLPRAVWGTTVPAGLALREMLQDEAHIAEAVRDMRKAASALVTEVMSSPVQSVEVDVPIGQVAALMEALDYRQLPVTLAGKLVGLVTRRDIVRAIADRA